jgi:hypothetical protein
MRDATTVGFHAFRREAITAISASAGVGQAMNAAGRSKSDMSQEYTLVDLGAQERAVRAFQSRILGWAKFVESLDADVPQDLRKLLN